MGFKRTYFYLKKIDYLGKYFLGTRQPHLLALNSKYKDSYLIEKQK